MNNTSNSTTNTTVDEGDLNQDVPCVNQEISLLIYWLRISLYFLITTISIVGNTLVIWVVRSDQRLKTATNYFILNLAAAGILITVFASTPALATFLRGKNEIPNSFFGAVYCKTIHPMAGVCLCGEILTLVTIAVDRFLAIKYPMKRFVNATVARHLIIVVWLASFLACSPLFYSIKLIEYEGKGYCYEKWSPLFPENSAMIYTICYNVLFYVIPLSLITVLYAIIIHKVWSRHIPGQRTEANQRLENRVKKSVLKMLMTVVVVFAVCWLPVNIAMVLVDFGPLECVPPEMLFTGWFLAHSNAAVNPFVYLVFSQDYRRGVLKILHPLIGCCPHPPRVCPGGKADVTSDDVTSRPRRGEAINLPNSSDPHAAVITKSFKRREDHYTATTNMTSSMTSHMDVTSSMTTPL